jgi:hypothetical protein
MLRASEVLRLECSLLIDFKVQMPVAHLPTTNLHGLAEKLVPPLLHERLESIQTTHSDSALIVNRRACRW